MVFGQSDSDLRQTIDGSIGGVTHRIMVVAQCNRFAPLLTW
jgi:hypothetical protein